MIRYNLSLDADTYKTGHPKQIPPDTRAVYHYWEARSGAQFEEMVMMGLQPILHSMSGQAVTVDDVVEMQTLMKQHLLPGSLFDYKKWLHIAKDHNGRLPLSIKAVPEGTVVPVNNVMMSVENTCEQCAWLPGDRETMLSRLWYPCTVATNSREMKKVLNKYLHLTGTPSLLPFKLHDFGSRGCTSPEAAAIGGAAHLVNFLGTDTMIALKLCRDVYYEPCAGFSIDAMEHFTVTSWGRDNEAKAYENMLDTHPNGLVAIVSDSYNLENAVRNIFGKQLKEKILSRDGTLVVRPDSGIPWEIVPQVLRWLDEAFGSKINEKGYAVLNPKVSVIQGDGVNLQSMEKVLHAVADAGFSTDNVTFGCGGALLQSFTRDTQRCAYKASARLGQLGWESFNKCPETDPTKASKKGKLQLIRLEDGSYKTLSTEDKVHTVGYQDQLVEVFRDGEVLVDYSFDSIRERAAL